MFCCSCWVGLVVLFWCWFWLCWLFIWFGGCGGVCECGVSCVVLSVWCWLM